MDGLVVGYSIVGGMGSVIPSPSWFDETEVTRAKTTTMTMRAWYAFPTSSAVIALITTTNAGEAIGGISKTAPSGLGLRAVEAAF